MQECVKLPCQLRTSSSCRASKCAAWSSQPCQPAIIARSCETHLVHNDNDILQSAYITWNPTYTNNTQIITYCICMIWIRHMIIQIIRIHYALGRSFYESDLPWIRPSMNQTFHESVRWKTIANRLHDRWGCHPPDHNYLPSRQTATLSAPVWITQSYIKTCCYQSLFANNLKCNHLHTHIKKLSSTWHTLHIQQPCLQSAPIACHAADNPASECQHTHQAHSQRNNIQVYICTPHYTSIATLWNTLTMPHK